MSVAILAIIFTLVLVIGIHEAGHALVAWLFGIKIKRIAIGFGKPLLHWRSHSGCEWVLGMWFIGGYVQLNNTRISPVKTDEYSTCFDKKPVWQRILVLLAGAAANLLTACCAFTLVYYVGIEYRIPQIQTVELNSIAAKAGLKPQEQWVNIGGQRTDSWEEVGQELIINWGSANIPISIKAADGQMKQSTIDLSLIQFSSNAHSLLNSIGISPNKTAIKHKIQASSLLQAADKALGKIGNLISSLLLILKQVILGIIPFSVLLGPVGLLATSIASLTQGIVVFSYFIATLSTAVALINLFPIPGLDGGSVVYAVLEKIRGRPVSVAVELLIYRLMLVALFLLLVQLIKNDIVSLLVKIV